MRHAVATHTTRDGIALHTRHWLPAGDPADDLRAVVLILHGYAEHCGRYAHVAEFLAGQGYAVYTLDQRGHGQSDGLRGYIDAVDAVLADVYEYFQTARAAHPDRAVFVLGHSVGAMLALRFTALYQDELAGLITSGPPLIPGNAVPGPAKLAARLLGAVVPKLKLMALEGGMVSKDFAVQQAYNADPLNYTGKMHARTGAELLRLTQDALAAARQITLPVLALHGSEDVLGHPDGLDLLYDALPAADKTKKLYHGLYHEILNEPEQDEVLADVADWLAAHV